MSLAAVLEADWKLPPFLHQLKEFENHCDDHFRALAWSMRTGKTKAIIDKACHLYDRRHKIDAVLIFAPNGVHANWQEVEFQKHAWPGVEIDPLIWRSAQLSKARRNRLGRESLKTFEKARAEWWKRLRKARTTPNLMVLAVPTESMTREDVRRVVAYLIQKRRVFVVFDESDDWGIPGSKRTKMARALAARCPYRAILSGTMLTGSPLAAFTQFELLKPGALGFSRFGDFKDHFTITEQAFGPGGRRFPKIIGFKNMDELRERMAPFMSVVLRSDVADMPALNFRRHDFTPSDEQLRVYREVHDTLRTDINGGKVGIGSLAPRIQKLQQVFSGFLIDEYRKLHTIPGAQPRINALLHELYIAPGKCVVWCAYKEDFANLRAALALEEIEFAEYHGGIPDDEKPAQLARFTENPKVKAFLAHPQSIARGRDLSAASTLIWYSHTFKARFRSQALERASVVGGGNVSIVDLVAPGPDAYMIGVTEGRIKMNDSLTGEGMKKLIEGLAL